MKKFGGLLLLILAGILVFLSFVEQDKKLLSEEIESLVLGFPAGEYDYDLDVIYDLKGATINAFKGDLSNKPTIIKALEDIERFYPNVKKISIVVTWYINSTEADNALITPKVSQRIGPAWQVENYTRVNSPLLINEYGKWEGTPSDKSIVKFVQYLSNNGIEVYIYPIILVDDAVQSWRGFIKAKSENGLNNFFKQYEKFILHYANLEYQGIKLNEYLSGFILGSELESLMKYKSHKKGYIFVNKMKELAEKVRSQLPSDVEISYAANWTEYHSDDMWYNLDELWGNESIDFIGINAYFPLTSHISKVNDLGYIDVQKGWTSGEYYEYLLDPSGKKISLDHKFAIKNIYDWWSSEHINPDGKKTKWKPKMKPIVFTELGFIPLDRNSDAPYQYIDESKSDLGVIKASKAHVNPKYQYEAIKGTVKYIKKLKKKFATMFMIKDVFWYNVDTKYNNYDNIYNYELKIHKYEEDLLLHKQSGDKSIREIIKKDPNNFN